MHISTSLVINFLPGVQKLLPRLRQKQSRAVAAFMGIPFEAPVIEITGKSWHVFSFNTGLAEHYQEGKSE